MKTDNLLIEIGTEELPPKSLKLLGDSFAQGISKGLKESGLAYSSVKALATPRRLAVQVSQLEAEQQDKVVEKKGPSVDVAFDSTGTPTKAAEGWARSNGITIDQAQRLKTDKGEWLLHKAEVKGEKLENILPGIVESALKQLPIPKPMRWGDSDAQFIRPVHTLTLVYGSDLINAEILDTKSDRHILGHRFHSPEGFELHHSDDYEQQLREHYVIADQQTRMQTITDEVKRLAAEVGGTVVHDPDLIEEVSALVEWPVALTATFDAEFLAIPKEPLIGTMKDDQRYFPIEDDSGSLLPRFIFISNIESKDPKQVIQGNEKVIRPRLADAQFFFEADKKSSLASRVDKLASVLFQKQLGSIKDKSDRISQLSAVIAEILHTDADLARQAGFLCKADLVTEMVLEFPDTQGTMGKHYALNDGEPEIVANAIEQHYWPRFSGDDLPTSDVACAVALADKLDTLIGIFGIGQVPKGDRDPFALRRAALGLIRIIVEKGLNLDLHQLIEAAAEQFDEKLTNKTLKNDVFSFLMGRFRPWYQDQGIQVDVIQAVIANSPSRPADFDARIKAITAFKQLEAAESLAEANKRVSNILSKAHVELTGMVNHDLLIEPQEQTLAAKIAETELSCKPELETGNYEGALNRMASLKDDIDAFFDHVMVNADDQNIKQNRLNLLHQLRELFLRVADISLLNK
ncbi:glycine--tRNA ligase subunit beta [Idiomarina seosinensis]|uniref:Glycine--tRNA ligase beta subunit n=1 Tax=Idiomarina seosinensis TaxID=281739 RepID=A0A432ZE20_9GAMM|nr:glycine--tRNA ligase subunit beta [Idiomarina seosinensis]RUO76217.1 glycine--tRNA ligase subunit beta [Idiomarina seosinensis]